jgi:cephalosporin hydroxylase
VDETARRFAQLYWDRGVVWFTRGLGMPFLQNPLDVWAIQDIIWGTRPQVLVETGTHSGASAHLWALLLAQSGGEEIITVDIDHRNLVAHKRPSAVPIHWLRGDSVDLASVVAEQIGNRRAMVILDSDHSQSHVAKELDAYSALVADGCYLICQDTSMSEVDVGVDDPGPWPAVQAFLEGHPEFAVDKSREPLFTFCTDGYLIKGVPNELPKNPASKTAG